MSPPCCLPWRSVWLPRAITAVALAIGLPLFLRMPPWCDITLYQVAAQNILRGGVHYRDVFDTNLPGFVWVITAISSVFGFSPLAVRVVDTLVVLGIVLLLDRLAKWGGATPATRWWAFAGAALFYPFIVEMAHAQRDTWMALPALLAVVLRVRRGTGAGPIAPSSVAVGEANGEVLPPVTSPFRASFVEGVIWGTGVWMKPHIALMALVVWLLSARRIADGQPRPWRTAGLDLLGNLLGGVAIGVPGVVWMVASGAWGPFLDVFLNWNPLYMKLAAEEFDWRVDQQLFWFPPWSLFLIVTVPLALASVLDMAPWQSRARAGANPERAGWLGRWLPRLLWDKQAGADARFVRGVLGALYITWAAQAFFVQRGFLYAHVPETLLMLALWASHRWVWVPIILLWLAVTSGLWLAADYRPDLKERLDGLPRETRERFLPRHPITNLDRLQAWPDCWRFNMSDEERYQLWDRLRLHEPHEASIGWEELHEVAKYLRDNHIEHETVAWFDSPHAVYLMLGHQPKFRYMHIYTALSISVHSTNFKKVGVDLMLDELKESGAKYVINDLEWTTIGTYGDPARRAVLLAPAKNTHDLLPPNTPYPDFFPFNQPTVFRTRGGTGRYVVHRVVSYQSK
jgi:hypothetical protein